VCNGGFEYNSAAPHALHCIDNACPWNKTGQVATPDLFNVTVYAPLPVSSGNWVRVPNNFAGYQQPKVGNGYAGIITHSGSIANYREYCVQPLLTPLQAGKRYRVSFWVSLGNYAGYKTQGMGAWLSPTDPNALGYSGILSQTPQIDGTLYTSTIGDTTNWVLITDTITPQLDVSRTTHPTGTRLCRTKQVHILL
jgi:hypothetical protein